MARPSKEVLAGLLERHTLASVGEMYGVTRERVRQWAKGDGIEQRKGHEKGPTHSCPNCGANTPDYQLYCCADCRSTHKKANLIHGIGVTYSYHKCRCEECRRWNREAIARRIAERRYVPVPKDVPHGVANTYVYYSCRCDQCRKAWSIKNLEYKQKAAEKLAG